MNTFTLKIMAILLMVIDHVGTVFFPNVIVLRLIGRAAFPIFAYLTAVACQKTAHPGRHLLRLGIFALISEIPCDLAIYGTLFYREHQNVFFTLFLGALAIYLHERWKGKMFWMLPFWCCFILGEVAMGDYRGPGVALIFALYHCRRRWQLAATVIGINLLYVLPHLMAFQVATLRNTMQLWTAVALIPIFCYNGKRGPKFKYFFYWFYPVHFVILYLLHAYG